MVQEIQRGSFPWFQFLIGTLKTSSKYLSSHQSYLFQFLIGTLKTMGAIKDWRNWTKQFQFLIGTLKTSNIEKKLEQAAEFQFLIGTLKTRESLLFASSEDSRFNSS